MRPRDKLRDKPRDYVGKGPVMGYFIRRLPFIAAICGLMTLVPGLVSAAEQGQIRAVIERQLDAFARDDGGTAYGAASPMIQRLFGDPDNFLAMVRAAYPQVYRHRRVEFGDLSQVNGEWVQLVVFTGLDGHKVLAIYSLLKDNRGRWRINGCRLLQQGEVGA